MESGGDAVGLALCADGGGVGGQVADGGNENMGSGFRSLEPLILFEGGFDRLNGVEIPIFPE
jgi:hypothetical protein